MKKLTKMISILMIFMIFISMSTTAFATPITGVSAPDTMTGASVSGTEKITGLGNQIITILTIVGVVASIIVLIVLGIKYMMGSAEEKAEYKKTMMPYIIGAGLVFAASAISGMLYNFLTNLG